MISKNTMWKNQIMNNSKAIYNHKLFSGNKYHCQKHISPKLKDKKIINYRFKDNAITLGKLKISLLMILF